MASIEGVVRAKLLADSAVQALVGARVHPEGDTPADAEFPRIEYTQASRGRTRHLKGYSNLNFYEVSLDCHALRKSEAVALAKAVNDCLLGAKWEDGERGFEVKAVFDSDEQDATADLDDGGEARVCTRSLTLKVWFRGI
jgi:hypothetical protein